MFSELQDIHDITRYNLERRMFPDAVRIVQRLVGASVTGRFDNESSRRIRDWQSSRERKHRLESDGRLEPLTLGAMIDELLDSGEDEAAAILFEYPNEFTEICDRQPPLRSDPVEQFDLRPAQSLCLMVNGNRVTCRGGFAVNFRLRADLDCSRFEYRQYIAGHAVVRPGWLSSAQDDGSWVPVGEPWNVSSALNIPGGLHVFPVEDGRRIDGRDVRFGHRDQPLPQLPGIEDAYTPFRLTGNCYRHYQMFEFDLEEIRPGFRIDILLRWIGQVVDMPRRRTVLASRQWQTKADEIIR